MRDCNPDSLCFMKRGGAQLQLAGRGKAYALQSEGEDNDGTTEKSDGAAERRQALSYKFLYSAFQTKAGFEASITLRREEGGMLLVL